MRALLFTVFGVVVAATAGVSYLALSPAPQQSSDSLKLVIETGSIPSTREAAQTDNRDEPTGSLGADGATAQDGGAEPSLDEVIAARLRQAEESPAESDDASSASTTDDGGQQRLENTATIEADAEATQGTAGQMGGMGAASTSNGDAFDTPQNVSSPSGTVSITQMLASELNADDGDSASSGDETAQQTQQASNVEADEAAGADETVATEQSSDDQVKTAGRLTQETNAADGDDPGSVTPSRQAETAARRGKASGMSIAALDPDIGQQTAPERPDIPSQETTAPTETESEPQNTSGNEDQQPSSRPQLLSAAEAPALPRQRGDFRVNGRIALILRGLGVEAELTEQAIAQMPQQVAMAFVPYGEELKSWTQRARRDRHEILIQIPLEPEGYPDNNPGPHTLLTSLSIDENLEHLDWLLDRFDGITGVTNYLGGKFASSPGAFAPMLMELKARDLLYVDDSKAANATTRQLARQVSLAYSVADVVIDAKREPDAIQQKLSELEAQARENGSAIAIGHAHAATLTALESWLGSLNDKGLALVPISELTTPPRPRVSQSTGG